MEYTLQNGERVEVRLAVSNDYEGIVRYINSLSDQSKRKFSPHSFDHETLKMISRNQYDDHLKAVIAYSQTSKEIIAYALIKLGLNESDRVRYGLAGIALNAETDVTFAPSVTDSCQHMGVGSVLFGWIMNELNKMGKQRVILWGGVQATNFEAIAFYQKFGFTSVGYFEHEGINLDMMLRIDDTGAN